MMAARPQMDHELSVITNDLLDMTNLIEETIRGVIKSLVEKDSDLARELIRNDEEIDDLEDEIKDKCLKFLATAAGRRLALHDLYHADGP